MRPSTENKIIFGIGISGTQRIQPPFREKLFGIRVYHWVMKRIKEGWNNHAVGGDGVVVGDREGSSCFIGNLLRFNHPKSQHDVKQR